MTEMLLIILVCMAGSAFFSGIETGVISINRVRLRHALRNGDQRARQLAEFVEHFDKLLGTTLVGNNLCLVVISVTAASMAVQLLGEGAEIISSLVMSILLLIFCEYLPKAWFHGRPLERCSRFVPGLLFFEPVFRPISKVVILFTRIFIRGNSNPYSKTDVFVTREDIKRLARDGEKTGSLSKRERMMIHRVFELGSKTARDIMIPREKMVEVPSSMPVEEFFEVARRSGHTRMPVFNPDDHKYTGIVNVFFVLSSLHQKNGRHGATVADYMRPVKLLAADTAVDNILPRMRAAKQPMCLVADKDRNVIGVVTTEDILSEVVGEISR